MAPAAADLLCRKPWDESIFDRCCFGYARVSTPDQNPAHQVDALVRAGIDADNMPLDHASGAKASRPQLDAVLTRLRGGDTLVITRLDRLGRSVLHLINLGAELRERGIGPQAGSPNCHLVVGFDRNTESHSALRFAASVRSW